jgi:hypothetical protein
VWKTNGIGGKTFTTDARTDMIVEKMFEIIEKIVETDKKIVSTAVKIGKIAGVLVTRARRGMDREEEIFAPTTDLSNAARLLAGTVGKDNIARVVKGGGMATALTRVVARVAVVARRPEACRERTTRNNRANSGWRRTGLRHPDRSV